MRPIHIALVTEGTYPHAHGGVSVWCDQVIRGLPEYAFDLVSISGSGAEQPVWELPDNVTSLRSAPLWGPPPRPQWISRRDHARLENAARSLVDSILEQHPDVARLTFKLWLRRISEDPYRAQLESVLTGNAVVTHLLQSLRLHPDLGPSGGHERQVAPTVGDAIVALQILGHSLRPLWLPPQDADVVHCVSNGVATLVALAAKWDRGTPCILWEHGVYLRERYLAFQRSAFPWTVKWFLMRFLRQLTSLAYAEAELIAPCNVYNRRWEVRAGAPIGAVRTVYNGVDPGSFPFLRGEPTEPTLAWIGRIDPLKDLETLIRAFWLVHLEDPEVRLRLFGPTPRGNESYQRRIVELAQSLGVSDAVDFEGQATSVREAYDSAHVILLTSISEGLPYTLLEAMSSGRATVSTDVGGVPEAVGNAGMLVPPRDPVAVAEASLKLLHDNDLRRRLGTAARDRVLELFTLDRAIGTLREIYRDVALAGERDEVRT